MIENEPGLKTLNLTQGPEKGDKVTFKKGECNLHRIKNIEKLYTISILCYRFIDPWFQYRFISPPFVRRRGSTRRMDAKKREEKKKARTYELH